MVILLIRSNVATMVFQGEGKVLEENILKKRLDFVKTLTEWSVEEREQIHKSVGISGVNSTDFLSIPKGSTFYLTDAILMYSHNGTGEIFPIQCALQILDSTGGFLADILNLTLPKISITAHISHPFAKILKIEGGSTLRLNSFRANTQASAIIYGWILPKKLI